MSYGIGCKALAGGLLVLNLAAVTTASGAESSELLPLHDEGPGGDAVPVTKETLRRTIADLELLTAFEREQLLPWLSNQIAAYPEVMTRGQLSDALDEQVARLDAQLPQSVLDEEALLAIEATPPMTQERASFEALMRQQVPLPPSIEIRHRIETLTLDARRPEVGLNQAMELAGLIDRLEDPVTQETLREFLEDRLEILQADLPEEAGPRSHGEGVVTQ